MTSAEHRAPLAIATLVVALGGCTSIEGVDALREVTSMAQPDGAADGDATVANALDTGAVSDGSDAADGGPCVPDGSSENCGACGHSCLGAPCSSGVCAPTVLASGPAYYPWEIALSNDHAYFTQFQDYNGDDAGHTGGAVYRVSKASVGGTPATMTAGFNIGHPDRIVVDAVSFYWTDFNDETAPGAWVATCPLGGCPGASTNPLSGSENFPDGIAIDATTVYWVENGTGQVRSCAIAGCSGSAKTLAGSEMGASALAVDVASDGTHLYWTTSPGEVRTCGVGSGTCVATTFASNQQNPVEVVVVDHRVYWTAVGTGSIFVCPTTGCSPALVPLVTGQIDLAGLAVDSTNVYWVASSSSATAGAVLTCPVAGCGAGPLVIAAGLNQPHGIALDNAYVYFTTLGDGAVQRVAK